ncbi:desulfoferrodoxin [Thermosulfurimonas marina]|uniref:Desulfoferrodoxin n=1 Tax=Thermosulfurimonas marina TaxID=2047767 RepID=A0A6H1WTN7_9BACT|nr:desulfoferrodoxin family protein [Thermosulfurimonas marina]QJA06548.1 desulfoferrodoxin [Thermosulfurimonas marina]
MERRTFLKAVAGILVGGPLVAREARGEETYLRLKDPAHPSLLEKKHVPAVEAPSKVKAGEWFEVRVRVGYLVEHPSTPEHWITRIELLCNGKQVAEVRFPRGGNLSPVAVFRVRLNRSAVLEAVENCNLHGTWISEPVKVEVS